MTKCLKLNVDNNYCYFKIHGGEIVDTYDRAQFVIASICPETTVLFKEKNNLDEVYKQSLIHYHVGEKLPFIKDLLNDYMFTSGICLSIQANKNTFKHNILHFMIQLC